jgi:MFS family permease
MAALPLRGGLLPSVSRVFIARYALAYMSTSLVLVAPLLVTLALKVEALVGKTKAPGDLALVAGVGALVAMVGNPLAGKLSDRTTSRLGMRRPWMVAGLAGGSAGVLLVALAPNIEVVLIGWCVAQLCFNALLASLAAVLPDRVPAEQRGVVSGVLGVCLPVAAVSGTFLVQLFAGNQIIMFLAPCVLGAVFIVPFAASLADRRVTEKGPAWSLREVLRTFAVAPRTSPDFAWAFASRFLFVSAYALLVTYQAYFLRDQIGTAKDDVPHVIFLGTAAQAVIAIAASLVGGKLSDRTGRRKVFVAAASVTYGAALIVIATSSTPGGYLIGMALSGLGFGTYMAVDLALVADVLPDADTIAKDLGILNIAGALPFFVAPALAPAVLALGGGSYSVLYTFAGACALLGAAAIVPVKGVR